jgi:hypothetical protein
MFATTRLRAVVDRVPDGRGGDLARLPRVLELSYTSLAMARRQAGYVDGNNVVIQYRWGGNQTAQLPALAAELAHLPVTVLVTSGGDDAVDAARAATSTIPIVTTIGYDPVNGERHGRERVRKRPGAQARGDCPRACAERTQHCLPDQSSQSRFRARQGQGRGCRKGAGPTRGAAQRCKRE